MQGVGRGARGAGLEARGGKLDWAGSCGPLGGLGLLREVICSASGWALRQGAVI